MRNNADLVRSKLLGRARAREALIHNEFSVTSTVREIPESNITTLEPPPKTKATNPTARQIEENPEDSASVALSDDDIDDFFTRMKRLQPHPEPQAQTEPEAKKERKKSGDTKRPEKGRVEANSIEPNKKREEDINKKLDEEFADAVQDIELDNVATPKSSTSQNPMAIQFADDFKALTIDQRLAHINSFVFGHKDFICKQLEVLRAAQDINDVLAYLPSGGGTTLIGQIHALISKGITLVFLPHASTIQQHITYLNSKHISAFNISDTSIDVSAHCNSLLEGRLKLAYTTPQDLMKATQVLQTLGQLYNEGKIDRWIVQEAQCISMFGDSFQQGYLHLKALRNRFPRVPCVALGRPSPKLVRDHIVTGLDLHSPTIICGQLARDNLHFEVRHKTEVINTFTDIGNYIQHSQSEQYGLIFCLTSTACTELSTKLQRDLHISAQCLHTDLMEEQRNSIARMWQEGSLKVLITTSSSLLPFHRQDVRYVIHTAMPNSIETYVQECANAGQDGITSYCILYYDFNDKQEHERLILATVSDAKKKLWAQSSLYKLMDYCEDRFTCRKVMLHDQLQTPICAAHCDNCKYRANKDGVQDYQKVAIMVLTLVQELVQRSQVVLAVPDLIARIQENPSHALPSSIIRQLLLKLLSSKVLTEEVVSTNGSIQAQIYVGSKAERLLHNEINIKLNVPGRTQKSPETLTSPFALCPSPVKIIAPPILQTDASPNVSSIMKPEIAKTIPETKQLERNPISSPNATAKGTPQSWCTTTIARAQSDVVKPDFQARLRETQERLKGQRCVCLTREDSEELFDRLLYSRNRLMLRNVGDRGIISSIFTLHTLMDVTHSAPRSLQELRLCAETHPWDPRETSVFQRYGQCFLAEILHYLTFFQSRP